MNTIAEQFAQKSVYSVEDLMPQKVSNADFKQMCGNFKISYKDITDTFLNITRFKTVENDFGYDIRTNKDFQKLKSGVEHYLNAAKTAYYMQLPNGSFIAKGTKIWSFIYKFNMAKLPYKHVILVDRSTQQLVDDQVLNVWTVKKGKKTFVNCESLIKDTMILNKEDFMELLFLQAPKVAQLSTVNNHSSKVMDKTYKVLFSKRIFKFGKRFE